jgi:hypothetical protein
MAVVPASPVVIAAVVPAAVLPGVLRLAMVLPAACATANVVAPFAAAVLVAAVIMPVVPFLHFLPVLAPLGLLPAAAPPTVPASSAGAAALPAAAGPPAAAARRAAAGVTGAPCSLPALRAAGSAARRPAVGHLLHQVQGRFSVNMFVRMDRVGCPPSVDRLRHLLLCGKRSITQRLRHKT